MQLSSKEEFGLRCLLRVAQESADGAVSIAEVSSLEGISHEYAARLLGDLRRGDLVSAERGSKGGYRLVRPATEVTVWDAICVLGGPFLAQDFCACHSGRRPECVRASDCAIRAVWRRADQQLRQLFESITLADLGMSEAKTIKWLAADSLLGAAARER